MWLSDKSVHYLQLGQLTPENYQGVQNWNLVESVFWINTLHYWHLNKQLTSLQILFPRTDQAVNHILTYLYYYIQSDWVIRGYIICNWVDWHQQIIKMCKIGIWLNLYPWSMCTLCKYCSPILIRLSITHWPIYCIVSNVADWFECTLFATWSIDTIGN